MKNFQQGNQKGGTARGGKNSGGKSPKRANSQSGGKAKTGAKTSGKIGGALRQGGGSRGFITGRIDGNQKGFAFLLNEKGDLYISKENLCGARHGDTVKAVRTGDHAEVKEILARGTGSVVGTYYESGKRGYVVPDDSHFATIYVDKSNNKTGEKVVVAFRPDGDGQIIETLGAADDEGVDLKSIIRSFNLHEKFPKSVLKDADKLEDVTDAVLLGREDFRKEIAFTIDGEDSRDFDDAVSIKKTTGKDGGYVLTVHIADVAHYVAPDSPLDKEAFSRGTSVYFPFATLPMLPERLSEDLCCLKEGEDRLTLSVVMHINSRGEVTKHRIVEGVINCEKRLTYQKVDTILNGIPEMQKEYKRVAGPLKDMHDLCLLLLNRRKERGAIDFEADEPEITMKDGKVLNIKKADRLISHRMIEEFMILANETVAADFFAKKTPFIYRGHAAPPSEKLERFEDFLATLGINFDYMTTPAPKDFARLLESVPQDLKGVVSTTGLRAMTKAVYEPESKGHYGLALKRYCHFTAPIRRYPDLFIHRVIKAHLKGEKLKKYAAKADEASKQSSLTERQAEEASRRVNDLLTAKYMAQFIGEIFEGIVSGVTGWGVFVRLDNTAEGLIRAEKLTGEYTFDERSMSLRGGENVYKMGQRVKVKLVGVLGDRIEFMPNP